jgi:phage gpG-like protein
MAKKSMQQLMADWKEASEKMRKFQNDLPMIMGEESVNIIKKNFRLKAYDSGNGLELWYRWSDTLSSGRKAATDIRYWKRVGVKGTTYSPNAPLLRQTLTLYNSIMFRVTGKTVFVGTNTSLVPYAPAHNEGSKQVPKRKYIPANGEPPNQKILAKIDKKIKSTRNEIMKNFKK